MQWLSPQGIQTTYQFSRAKVYRLLKDYVKSGGEYFRSGNQTRVPEKQFTEFLKRKCNETD